MRHLVKMNRNIEYIKANIIIMWHYLTEYKINLFNILLTFGFVTIINIFIAYFISLNFGDTISWRYEDFLLLSAFSGILWGIYGMFHWTNEIHYNIVQGNLNTMLIRPMKMPIKYYFHSFAGGGFVYLMMSIFFLIFISLYFKIVFVNYLYGFLMFILILLFFSLSSFAIDSFNLIMLGLGNQFDVQFRNFNNNLLAYPSQFFSLSKIKFVLNFVPMYFVSSLLIPILTNKQISYFKFQMCILITMTIVSFVVLLINWHFGLKKYEAFG